MENIQPKKYNFNTVHGITLNQLTQHYTLYKGYVTKLNEIWDMTTDASKYGPGNPTYSPMRSLKLGETYALDGVRLHELYFENMTCGYNTPCGRILSLINRDFGSYDNFVAYFTKVGASMRGWTTLMIDPIDDKLHVIGSDFHDVGVPWVSCPLLVMDVYEHAYMIDFGIDKAKYMEIFVKNINWCVVNKRLHRYMHQNSIDECDCNMVDSSMNDTNMNMDMDMYLNNMGMKGCLDSRCNWTYY